MWMRLIVPEANGMWTTIEESREKGWMEHRQGGEMSTARTEHQETGGIHEWLQWERDYNIRVWIYKLVKSKAQKGKTVRKQMMKDRWRRERRTWVRRETARERRTEWETGFGASLLVATGFGLVEEKRHEKTEWDRNLSGSCGRENRWRRDLVRIGGDGIWSRGRET